MEGATQTQGRSSEAPGPRPRPLQPRHQLDVRYHEAQKTSHLPLEKHTTRLDERETGALQIRAHELGRNPQATSLRKPPDYKPRRQAPGPQRPERRKLPRERGTLKNPRLLGLRR